MSLVANDLCKNFGEARVIRGVSFEIEDGQFVSLVGKSGSGKSTLLYLLSSLDFPSSGSVRIDGRELTGMDSQELHGFRNRRMGFVFQFHYLLPEFTAIENVLMPALKAGEVEAHRPEAERLLREFDLGGHMHHYPSQLSGGQAQRVALIRSVIMQPRFLFADEPTGALDSKNAGIIGDLFRRINAEMNTTIICVTHDPDFAALAPRQVRLVDGTLQD